VIRYRPFRNTDPPHLAEVWRAQPPLRALMQPMSVAILDRLILSKPYFDRQGLIVAVEDEQPIGASCTPGSAPMPSAAISRPSAA
jgi:hypothetical protein